jgi:hypothetical protein
MQIKFRLLSVIALIVFTSLVSCKKDVVLKFDTSTEVQTHSDDQTNVSNDMDDIANDVNVAVESSSTFSGKMENIKSICNATAVYDSVSNPRKITVTYGGANCYGTHSRTGVIVLSMATGTHWKDAGAVLTVTVTNLKITRLIDNKSITINGTQTFTNVSGGLMFNLASLQSITHTISGNMSITFDDNSVRAWQVARKRVFTYSGGIVITITGNHTDGNNTQIAEWGSNRYGHSFTTSITEPLVIRQDCDFRLTSGQVTHEGFATAIATFGLDANGNATSCPGTGHYNFKLEWVGLSGSKSVILPY